MSQKAHISLYTKGDMMRWTLHSVGVKPSKPLMDHAEKSFRDPLQEMGSWIRSASLRFRDDDMSDLQAGRHIKAVVELTTGRTIVVDQEAPDYYSGVTQLATRVKRHIRRSKARHLKRRQSRLQPKQTY